MIRITILLLLNIFLAAGNIAAQYNLPSNRNWIFGYHTGISFNNNNITVLQSSMANGEGCSAVSDDQGNLLFYSDGHRVWSANGNLMPNGDTLIIPILPALQLPRTAWLCRCRAPPVSTIFLCWEHGCMSIR